MVWGAALGSAQRLSLHLPLVQALQAPRSSSWPRSAHNETLRLLRAQFNADLEMYKEHANVPIGD